MKDRQGILFIVSAPSGAGKTTLVKALVDRIQDLVVSVSHTTRPQRPNETEGKAYHFVDTDLFQQMVKAGEFLEHATVFDFYYGTSKQTVVNELSKGNDVILEIDWQGARQIREDMDGCVSLFILPPSFDTLEQRLNQRGDDQSTVKRRMDDAVQELSHYGEYDFLVINDQFDVALQELETIILSMRHEYSRQKAHIDEFVAGLMEQAANIE